MQRILRPLLSFFVLMLCVEGLFADELYYTGFENFTVGNDTIAGTDGWTGSSAHAGLQLSGVDSEADHLLFGIGNAAFIGGRDLVLPATVTSRTVNVRRAFNVDPLTPDAQHPDGQEIVQFHVNFGIKDSINTGVGTRRDNFEFAFYNSAGNLIAFIQFDNTTLNPVLQAPAQTIWRSNWNESLNRFDKVNTDTVFFYDVLMELNVRINFRTNRWTANLDGLDIFADEPFYTGALARSLGTVAAQMQIANSVVVQGQNRLAPGSNFMLFDDFALRMDPLPDPFFYTFQVNSIGSTQFTWYTEALYKYQVQYSDDLSLPWKSDLPNSLITSSRTGSSPVFTDSTAAGKLRRFYRVIRSLP
jgi:hypothetical protein